MTGLLQGPPLRQRLQMLTQIVASCAVLSAAPFSVFGGFPCIVAQRPLRRDREYPRLAANAAPAELPAEVVVRKSCGFDPNR